MYKNIKFPSALHNQIFTQTSKSFTASFASNCFTNIDKMEETPHTLNGKSCTPITKRCPRTPLQLIKAHYGSITYNRTAAQLEREKYLIPRCIKFNRWWLIPAAVIIQFCCGSLYAWSVYNDPIEMYMYGQQTNTAPITFYLAVGCLGLSAALFGPWLERNGPSKTALLGTIGFLAGNLLASLAIYTKQMWLLYIGYGILGGSSIGICYISPVSALQKFFPDRRGLASGFAVCGFGAGSIAASPLQLLLIEKVGVPLTFVVLGCAYFCAMLLAVFTLRTPPPGYTVSSMTVEGMKVTSNGQKIEQHAPPTLKLSLIESLKTRDYWLMFGMFFGNVVTGLVVLSRLSTMIQSIFGKSKEAGAMVVTVNGGLNLAGRFIFSILSDKIGRKTVYLLSLCTQAIIVSSMTPILLHKDHTYWVFVILIWILSACYGCSFGVIPAFLADMFGASNIGACHGVMLIGWSTAGVGGGLIYTAIFNSMVAPTKSVNGTQHFANMTTHKYTTADAYPYLVNFYWLLTIILIAFILALFVRTNSWHRLLAAIDRRRVFYFSMCQRLLQINYGSQEKKQLFHLMSKEEIIQECDKRGGLIAFEQREGPDLENMHKNDNEMK